MKKTLAIILAVAMTLCLAACGDTPAASKDADNNASDAHFVIQEDPVVINPTEDTTSVDVAEEIEEDPDFIPENSYRSELTNKWISLDIENQRPIAVMIDNEKNAIPHYGTSDADIVYEMMNSTANGRITRLMCIVKDWQNLERFGSVRSTRSTNAYLTPEYNAILIHDGGPFYIDEPLSQPCANNHLSGGFARIDTGEASFYEEYITSEDYKGVGEYAGKTYSGLKNRIASAGYSTEYTKYYPGAHWTFAESEYTLEGDKNAIKAYNIELPFPHNESKLHYDEKTKTYTYEEYGEKYVDALYDDGRGFNFKNVILQCCDFLQFDDQGYMGYYIIGSDKGYYLTDGYAIPITWSKSDQNAVTIFKNANTGEQIKLNTGKTYIAVVPSDVWKDTVIE